MANYPLLCPVCNVLVWRFDLEKHFDKHKQNKCPPEGIISSAEKAILKKNKHGSKNALTKSDLDQLNDEELKLFPLNDFWDSKKKEWKKSVAGNFGKQNNARMKSLFEENKFQ